MDQEQLQAAWEILLDSKYSLDALPKIWASFDAAYARWEAAYGNVGGGGIAPQRIPPSELREWVRQAAEQKAFVDRAKSRYRRKSDTAPDGKPPPSPVVLGPVTVLGSLPWWYWPTRFGAATLTFYFVRGLLTPKGGVMKWRSR
jgi:hypothetical protein